MHNQAFIVGKFLPPHLGHLSLIKSARALARHVTVAVEQQPQEALPVEIRASLMQQDVPEGVKIQPFLKIMPPTPKHAPNEDMFWRQWKEEIHGLCPTIDIVVSSDDYGARLAQDQLAQWVKIDRTGYPVSATWVKENFWHRQNTLMPSTKAFFTKRVALLGSESTGKSVLCKMLAQQHHTAFLPEMAEQIIKAQRLDTTNLNASALSAFALSQQASRTGVLGLSDRVLFEDSNELTTALYARLSGFDGLAERLEKEFLENPPHHVIVCLRNGASFVPDVHRAQNDHHALELEKQTLEFLTKNGIPFSCVEGNWEQRALQAQRVYQGLEKTWESAPLLSHCRQAMRCNMFVLLPSSSKPASIPKPPFKV